MQIILLVELLGRFLNPTSNLPPNVTETVTKPEESIKIDPFRGLPPIPKPTRLLASTLPFKSIVQIANNTTETSERIRGGTFGREQEGK